MLDRHSSLLSGRLIMVRVVFYVLRYCVHCRHDRLASALDISNSLVAGSPTEIGGAVIISKGGGAKLGGAEMGG